jgi:hypothetical protein
MKERCWAFAKAELGSGSFDARCARNKYLSKQKFLEDSYVGKLGELTTKIALEFLELSCSCPDFEVYTRHDKRFSNDLTCNGFPLHVKTQRHTSAKRFGLSWTFQREDALFKRSDANCGVAFVMIHDGYGVLMALTHPGLLSKHNLFAEPKKQNLKSNKRVVYYSTMREVLGDSIWSFVTQAQKQNFYQKLGDGFSLF